MRARCWGIALSVALVPVAVSPSEAAGDEPICDPGTPTVIEFAGASIEGGSGNGPSFAPTVSGGGDLVGFSSMATDLGVDTGTRPADAFVRDLEDDTIEVVSLTPAGAVSAGYAGSPVLTPDGRHAVFSSTADDLDVTAARDSEDVFVRDRYEGTTTLMSVGSAWSSQQHSGPAVISDDGQVVVFRSTRGDLTPADTGTGPDLFARVGDTTELVSRLPGDEAANAVSDQFSLTPDGRWVVFERYVGGDQPRGQLYLHDRTTGGSHRIAGSDAPNTRTFSPDITDDGATVVFISADPGIVPGAPPGFHVYGLDVESGDRTLLVEGATGIGLRPERVVVSGDGSALAIQAVVTDRVGTPPDSSVRYRRHIIHVDLLTDHATVLTRTPSGGHPNDESFYPDISDDGSVVVFESWANNILPGDDNAREDAFIAHVGAPPTGPFIDVLGNHPFCHDVAWSAGEGIAGGYPDGTYRPGFPVARGAMAAFLHRFAGEPAHEAPDTPTFWDVPLTHPFFEEIEWLASAGIAGGYADGGFGPAEPVSRGAMAAFLHRFMEPLVVEPPGSETFPDVPASHVFFDEVEWLVGEDIAGGFADGTYRPANPVSRGAMAAFLHRAG